ncbi:MAG: iron-sulfur cluster assembly protein [Desulfurococcales archaeon]|nr:iron-sulfur cluster assembly protein [Desulfurococcales archaeon]MCE4605333.1 iron-sulfur cluster assembly protein [Desulfurococcales archaeon]
MGGEMVNAEGVVVSGDKEIVDRVVKALKEVYDPEIPVNIYDLGLIYEIHVEKGEEGPRIHVVMTITAIGCPVTGTIAAYAEEAIRDAVPEAEDVIVDVVFDPPWSPDRITEEGREMLKAIYGYDIVEQWRRQMAEAGQ